MTYTLDNICLYRITHIQNIPHILHHGIVHSSSPNMNHAYVTIGDTSLISFRTSKRVSTNNGHDITLGEYIPFYFGIRMPMLYVIQHGGNCVDVPQHPNSIIYLAISLKKIIECNRLQYYFSDGHATDRFSTFYDKSDIDRLPQIIDWNAVKARQWSGDGIETDLKRRKQAEFLIKGDIPFDFIVGFCCFSDTAKQRLVRLGVNESIVKVTPEAYY